MKRQSGITRSAHSSSLAVSQKAYFYIVDREKAICQSQETLKKVLQPESKAKHPEKFER